MQSSEDDAVLLERVARGNPVAFRMLTERHATRAYRVAFRIMHHQQSAEDIVQDVFLKLWEKPTAYNPSGGAQFSSWLYRVVTNAALNQRRQTLINQGDPALLETVSVDANTQDVLERQQMRHDMMTALESLPSRQHQALILCVFEEFSNQEAAEIMEISVSALQALLVRAKSALKKIINNSQNSSLKREAS